MSAWATTVLVAYGLVVTVLGLYGAHRYLMLHLYRKHRGEVPQAPARFADLPVVTVQLPLYNEVHVVERLLEAVARLDYPRDRLQVQVLDDSQDETQDLAQDLVARLRTAGLDIERLHRQDRVGFKAGALAAGLARARGEFLLVLDADFVAPADLLQRVIHHFTDPGLGMVQLRWGHLNRTHGLLARLQAIFLDGHFVIEHTARNRSGRFFNFNGTAGIWRRQAIVDAGGWQHDTLTEDLDLSYRAQLAGWRFLYLPQVEVPGELPVDMGAFQTQQHRWTKGAVQTGRKLLPRIWRSRLPWAVRLEATVHLTAHVSYLFMLLMALLTVPVLEIRSQLGWERLVLVDLPLFSFATLAISGFYLTAQRALYPDWRRQVKYLPALMALGMGMCVNNARAVLEGLVGHQSPFVRTPKLGAAGRRARRRPGYRSRRSGLAVVELGMAAYLAFALHTAWSLGLYLAMPFLLLFLAGFLFTGLQPWVQTAPWPGRRPR